MKKPYATETDWLMETVISSFPEEHQTNKFIRTINTTTAMMISSGSLSKQTNEITPFHISQILKSAHHQFTT